MIHTIIAVEEMTVETGGTTKMTIQGKADPETIHPETEATLVISKRVR